MLISFSHIQLISKWSPPYLQNVIRNCLLHSPSSLLSLTWILAKASSLTSLLCPCPHYLLLFSIQKNFKTWVMSCHTSAQNVPVASHPSSRKAKVLTLPTTVYEICAHPEQMSYFCLLPSLHSNHTGLLDLPWTYEIDSETLHWQFPLPGMLFLQLCS